MALLKWLIAVSLIAVGGVASAADRSAVLEYRSLAQRCAPKINVTTLTALLRHESSLNPYAIHVNDGSQIKRHLTNERDAVLAARRLLASGHNIDVGLGQINSANFHWLTVPLSALFIPCANLKAVATILHHCYGRARAVIDDRQRALRAALSCYNTGSLTQGLDNGYVQAIVQASVEPIPKILPIDDGSDRKIAQQSNPNASAIFITNRAPNGRIEKKKGPKAKGVNIDRARTGGTVNVFGHSQHSEADIHSDDGRQGERGQGGASRLKNEAPTRAVFGSGNS